MLTAALLIALPAASAAPAGLQGEEEIQLSIRYTAGYLPVAVTFPVGWDCQSKATLSYPPTSITVQCDPPAPGTCTSADTIARLAGLGSEVTGTATCTDHAGAALSASCDAELPDVPSLDASEPSTEPTFPVASCTDQASGEAGGHLTCVAQPTGLPGLTHVYGEVTCTFTWVPGA